MTSSTNLIPAPGISYKNGNYTVYLKPNGTKVRFGLEKTLVPDRPECIDICISKKCDNGCKYCYEGCTEDGMEADLNDPILDTIPEFTEIAINLNSSVPEGMDSFLERMYAQKVVVNVTVNAKNVRYFAKSLKDWQTRHLIYGIGVSVNSDMDLLRIASVQNEFKFENLVYHVINGIISSNSLRQTSFLDNPEDVAILILGFKETGRGSQYKEEHLEEMERNYFTWEGIQELGEKYKAICFDNLALEQLNIPYENDPRYMGDDGEYTFAIDLIERKYAVNSRQPVKNWHKAKGLTVTQMFQKMRRAI